MEEIKRYILKENTDDQQAHEKSVIQIDCQRHVSQKNNVISVRMFYIKNSQNQG